MDKLFSSRELAIAIYFFLFFLYVCFHQKTRKAMFNLIKAATAPRIVQLFSCLILFAEILIILLSKLNFWKYAYIKDIAIWVLFVGIPASFRAINKWNQPRYFVALLLDNLKFTVLVEYIISTFTFNFVIELILQPLLALLTLMCAIAKQEGRNDLQRFFDVISSILGFWILFFSFKSAWNSFQNLNSIDLIVSFWIPIFFSLFYIPAAYSVAVASEYEQVFMRMRFCAAPKKKENFYRKYRAMKACGLSIARIHAFRINCIPQMYRTMPWQEYIDLISKFKAEQLNPESS